MQRTPGPKMSGGLRSWLRLWLVAGAISYAHGEADRCTAILVGRKVLNTSLNLSLMLFS